MDNGHENAEKIKWGRFQVTPIRLIISILILVMIAICCLFTVDHANAINDGSLQSDTTPAQIVTESTAIRQIDDSFNQCAEKFFGPNFPAELKRMGLKFNSRYAYAWFASVAKEVMPSLPYRKSDFDEEIRPFFTPDGWKEYSDYLEQFGANSFFKLNKGNTEIKNIFESVPLLATIAAIKDKEEKIEAKLVFQFIMHSTFIQQGNPSRKSDVVEKFSPLIVEITQFEQNDSLKISSWKLTAPISDTPNTALKKSLRIPDKGNQ